MFAFFDNFDHLSNDKVILRITEKNVGDDELVPFYYYDVYNSENIHVGKISWLHQRTSNGGAVILIPRSIRP